MVRRRYHISRPALALIAFVLLLASALTPYLLYQISMEGQRWVGDRHVELVFRMAEKCISAALRAKVGSAIAYKLNASSGEICSTYPSLEAPAPLYVLTGNATLYGQLMDFLLSHVFSWRKGLLYRFSMARWSKSTDCYRPNLYVAFALELIHAYIATGNSTYLTAARILAHEVVNHLSEAGLPPHAICSNGTSIGGEDALEQPFHVGISLITLGRALDEPSLVRAGEQVVKAITSLASPLLPTSIRSDGTIVDARAYPLSARVPCAIADGLLLLRFLGRGTGELEHVANWLCNYYMRFAAMDPHGLFSHGYMDRHGIVVGYGIYTFVNQFNQLRFMAFWAYLTGNKTILDFVENVVAKVEEWFRRGRFYASALSWDLTSVCWHRLSFIQVTKFLSLLLELYMITGRDRYVRWAERVLEETLPAFELPHGYAYDIDIWTGQPLDVVQPTAIMLIAASEALCSSLIGHAEGCLPYLLPARGLKVPWAGYVDVRTRMARFVVDVFAEEGLLYLPLAREARVNNGSWCKLENGLLRLGKGRHVVEVRYGRTEQATRSSQPSLITGLWPAQARDQGLDDGRLLPRVLRWPLLAHNRR